ncbi:hypothetical protein PsorP6_009871 [Peronosclerospora sorghi]|uniref:Uncharacterized protein n=1 Tax=Peronosclerospora sorghi TaxID=230839 RepID=A0ACC0W145_9STRA|nr:hypothetical protein PsorP6_009871 [Peronosclerospora sorghi]
MFALGIVLYILLCGSHPFDPYNNLTDEESQVSPEPMKNSAELLEKFQRGRRRLCAIILAVLLIDAMTENLDEDEKQELESVKRSFSWGLSSSVEALNEKT